MRTGLFFVLLPGAAALAMLVAGNQRQAPALAADKWKMIIPGIAADSGRHPTSTPTPEFDTDRWVRLTIHIRALELAATGTGTLPVLIEASARAPLRSELEGPVTVTGEFTITPEGTDAAGCSWSRGDVNREFKITVYYNARQNLDVLLGIVSPTWHYDVTCPGGKGFRSPKFGEEGLELFLRDVMQPYLVSEVPNVVRLPTNVATETPCIKRVAYFSAHGMQTDPAGVVVQVYQPDYPGGCEPVDLPPLPPRDTRPDDDPDLVPLTP